MKRPQASSNSAPGAVVGSVSATTSAGGFTFVRAGGSLPAAAQSSMSSATSSGALPKKQPSPPTNQLPSKVPALPSGQIEFSSSEVLSSNSTASAQAPSSSSLALQNSSSSTPTSLGNGAPRGRRATSSSTSTTGAPSPKTKSPQQQPTIPSLQQSATSGSGGTTKAISGCSYAANAGASNRPLQDNRGGSSTNAPAPLSAARLTHSNSSSAPTTPPPATQQHQKHIEQHIDLPGASSSEPAPPLGLLSSPRSRRSSTVNFLDHQGDRSSLLSSPANKDVRDVVDVSSTTVAAVDIPQLAATIDDTLLHTRQHQRMSSLDSNGGSAPPPQRMSPTPSSSSTPSLNLPVSSVISSSTRAVTPLSLAATRPQQVAVVGAKGIAQLNRIAPSASPVPLALDALDQFLFSGARVGNAATSTLSPHGSAVNQQTASSMLTLRPVPGLLCDDGTLDALHAGRVVGKTTISNAPYGSSASVGTSHLLVAGSSSRGPTPASASGQASNSSLATPADLAALLGIPPPPDALDEHLARTATGGDGGSTGPSSRIASEVTSPTMASSRLRNPFLSPHASDAAAGLHFPSTCDSSAIAAIPPHHAELQTSLLPSRHTADGGPLSLSVISPLEPPRHAPSSAVGNEERSPILPKTTSGVENAWVENAWVPTTTTRPPLSLRMVVSPVAQTGCDTVTPLMSSPLSESTVRMKGASVISTGDTAHAKSAVAVVAEATTTASEVGVPVPSKRRSSTPVTARTSEPQSAATAAKGVEEEHQGARTSQSSRQQPQRRQHDAPESTTAVAAAGKSGGTALAPERRKSESTKRPDGGASSSQTAGGLSKIERIRAELYLWNAQLRAESEEQQRRKHGAMDGV